MVAAPILPPILSSSSATPRSSRPGLPAHKASCIWGTSSTLGASSTKSSMPRAGSMAAILSSNSLKRWWMLCDARLVPIAACTILPSMRYPFSMAVRMPLPSSRRRLQSISSSRCMAISMPVAVHIGSRQGKRSW